MKPRYIGPFIPALLPLLLFPSGIALSAGYSLRLNGSSMFFYSDNIYRLETFQVEDGALVLSPGLVFDWNIPERRFHLDLGLNLISYVENTQSSNGEMEGILGWRYAFTERTSLSLFERGLYSTGSLAPLTEVQITEFEMEGETISPYVQPVPFYRNEAGGRVEHRLSERCESYAGEAFRLQTYTGEVLVLEGWTPVDSRVNLMTGGLRYALTERHYLTPRSDYEYFSYEGYTGIHSFAILMGYEYHLATLLLSFEGGTSYTFLEGGGEQGRPDWLARLSFAKAFPHFRFEASYSRGVESNYGFGNASTNQALTVRLFGNIFSERLYMNLRGGYAYFESYEWEEADNPLTDVEYEGCGLSFTYHLRGNMTLEIGYAYLFQDTLYYGDEETARVSFPVNTAYITFTASHTSSTGF